MPDQLLPARQMRFPLWLLQNQQPVLTLIRGQNCRPDTVVPIKTLTKWTITARMRAKRKDTFHLIKESNIYSTRYSIQLTVMTDMDGLECYFTGHGRCTTTSCQKKQYISDQISNCTNVITAEFCDECTLQIVSSLTCVSFGVHPSLPHHFLLLTHLTLKSPLSLLMITCTRHMERP